MPPERGYEFFEHTADVGVRAWGSTLESAFGQAAVGVVAHMVDVTRAKPVGEAVIEVEGESDERLLFAFLEEVLFHVQSHLWIITEADVELRPGRLRATLRGESYDASRHGHVHEIKAMTWHGLKVQREPPRVEVIVDI